MLAMNDFAEVESRNGSVTCKRGNCSARILQPMVIIDICVLQLNNFLVVFSKLSSKGDLRCHSLFIPIHIMALVLELQSSDPRHRLRRRRLWMALVDRRQILQPREALGLETPLPFVETGAVETAPPARLGDVAKLLGPTPKRSNDARQACSPRLACRRCHSVLSPMSYSP